MGNMAIQTRLNADTIKTKACELLAERLKITPDEVSLEKKLTGYGLDSIDVMTMVGDLEDWLDIELPSTLFWDYETINDVANYISSNINELKA